MARRPIRVCFLIDEINNAGTEKKVLSLINKFDRDKIQPFLVLLRGSSDKSKKLRLPHCQIMRLGLTSFLHPMALFKILQLYFFLWYYKIDFLQMYFPDSTFVGFLVGGLIKNLLLIQTVNNLGYTVSTIEKVIKPFVFFLPHYTIANCNACKEYITQGKKKFSNIFVIENGIEITSYYPSIKNNSPIQIGMVANLRPVKNPFLFVKAASIVSKQCTGIQFSIAGDGPLRSEIEKYIIQNRLKAQFKLLGPIDDVPSYLSKLDIGVLCSSSEGMSNSILEYMANGIGIVATAVGGNLNLIQNGYNGLLVPIDDPVVLSKSILTLIENKKFRHFLGKNGKELARNKYSQAIIVGKYQAFYQSLLSEPG